MSKSPRNHLEISIVGESLHRRSVSDPGDKYHEGYDEMKTEDLTYSIQLRTQDPSVVVDLFGSESPIPTYSSTLIDGVDATVTRVEIQRGLVESSILVDFLLKVASGITAKVVGDLLFERIRSRRAKLSVNGRKVTGSSRRA